MTIEEEDLEDQVVDGQPRQGHRGEDLPQFPYQDCGSGGGKERFF